jgi:hypothetical protein
LALAWARAQRLPGRLVLRELGLADYDGMARFIPSRRVGGVAPKGKEFIFVLRP